MVLSTTVSVRANADAAGSARRAGSGQNGTSLSILPHESECPQRCGERDWGNPQCVKRIRKIHGRLSVPLRLRLAQIAHAAVSKANHYGVVVTGLNETQLQRLACVAKRLHGKSVTMVLMMAGNKLERCLTPQHP